MYEYGLLALRVLAGVGIMTHGIPKLRDIPGTMQWMRSVGLPGPAGIFAGVAETFGGLALILGIATPIAAALLLVNMCGALFQHITAKDSFKKMEDAYLYAIMFLCLALAGGGAFELLPLLLF